MIIGRFDKKEAELDSVIRKDFWEQYVLLNKEQKDKHNNLKDDRPVNVLI